MLSFLKVFVRGIVCTVLLPLILAVWVLYGVYCLIAFMVMLVKSIIVFFAGGSATGEMEEDRKARELILKNEQAQVDQARAMNMFYQNMAAQQMMQQPMAQPAVMPADNPVQQQPVQPQPAQFEPFIPDPVKEPPLPGTEVQQPIEDKGDSDDGQSN